MSVCRFSGKKNYLPLESRDLKQQLYEWHFLCLTSVRDSFTQHYTTKDFRLLPPSCPLIVPPVRPRYLAQMGCSSHRNPLPGSAGLRFAVLNCSCWLQEKRHTHTRLEFCQTSYSVSVDVDCIFVWYSSGSRINQLVSSIRVNLQITNWLFSPLKPY